MRINYIYSDEMIQFNFFLQLCTKYTYHHNKKYQFNLKSKQHKSIYIYIKQKEKKQLHN